MNDFEIALGVVCWIAFWWWVIDQTVQQIAVLKERYAADPRVVERAADPIADVPDAGVVDPLESGGDYDASPYDESGYTGLRLVSRRR